MSAATRSDPSVAVLIECHRALAAHAFPDADALRAWLRDHPTCHVAGEVGRPRPRPRGPAKPE